MSVKGHRLSARVNTFGLSKGTATLVDNEVMYISKL